MSPVAPNALVPLTCPRCGHAEAMLIVRSRSVVTLACASCRHVWAAEVMTLSETARQAAGLAALGIVD